VIAVAATHFDVQLAATLVPKASCAKRCAKQHDGAYQATTESFFQLDLRFIFSASRVTRVAISLTRPHQQVRHPHEKDAADDGPYDREWMPADRHDEERRQMELARQPGANERTEEADHQGDDETTGRTTGEGARNGSTDTGDDEIHDEFQQSHGVAS
jgi:hypothetical protein